MAPKKPVDKMISVGKIERHSIEVGILGTEPLICNRQSVKTRQQLLFPPAAKNKAEKAATLKHNVLKEFRDSPYTSQNADSPTLIEALPVWFKKGMGSAALDIEGPTKTQIGRTIHVAGERTPLYGLPRLFMAGTRDAGMNRTPNIRTRAIVVDWACVITVQFILSVIKVPSVLNLLSAAGILSGVGDWRAEKGSGTYGSYEVVDPSDERISERIAAGGRDVQTDLMNNPIPHNDETEYLLAWWHDEVKERGFDIEEAAG